MVEEAESKVHIEEKKVKNLEVIENNLLNRVKNT
jgi:hypothetical protein